MKIAICDDETVILNEVSLHIKQYSEKLGSKFIRLKTENGIENINISNILYTGSRSHYQHVNFTDGGQVRSRMTVSQTQNFW